MAVRPSPSASLCRSLRHHYAGPVDLEIIGAKRDRLEQCCAIAAESLGHMQASLQACGAR